MFFFSCFFFVVGFLFCLFLGYEKRRSKYKQDPLKRYGSDMDVPLRLRSSIIVTTTSDCVGCASHVDATHQVDMSYPPARVLTIEPFGTSMHTLPPPTTSMVNYRFKSAWLTQGVHKWDMS